MLAYNNGELAYFSLAELFLCKTIPAEEADGSTMNGHGGPVLSLSVSKNSIAPFFVTAAGGKDDASIRIFNYKTRKQVSASYFSVDRPPLKVSFHPSGWSFAAAFADGFLRFFHFLASRHQLAVEVNLSQIRGVLYGNSGSLLAVMHGKLISLV